MAIVFILFTYYFFFQPSTPEKKGTNKNRNTQQHHQHWPHVFQDSQDMYNSYPLSAGKQC